MDIKTITTLVAIADHRSFQAASLVLGTSLSNVSQQVQGLEQDLGVTLFDRSVRPPKLTHAGVQLVGRSRRLLAQWQELSNSVLVESSQGILNVGVVHTAVAGGVSTALGRLHKKDSGVFIQLRTALTTELIELLQRQAIDCAIVTEPQNPVLDTRFIRIAEEELGVIAHRNIAGQDYRQVLEQNPYIRFNRRATLAQRIDAELRRRRIKVKAAMEITTLDAVESLVKNGLGVSIVPVGKHVRTLPVSIRALSFAETPFYRSLGVMVREDCPRMHLVEHFLEELYRTYRTVKSP